MFVRQPADWPLDDPGDLLDCFIEVFDEKLDTPHLVAITALLSTQVPDRCRTNT
jgi:hypothetical protein